MPKSAFIAKVRKRRDVTDDLFCLWLDLDKNRQNFNFEPGQYCTIGCLDSNKNFIRDENSRNLVRAYSIVSSPQEDFIELFIELFPPPYGKLTPLLYELQTNDSVGVLESPKGVFTFEPQYANHLMVATVTGIAPFVSMIREYIRSGDGRHRFFVLHGASYHDEFTYDDELIDIAKQGQEFIQLEYVPTISRPNDIRNYHCLPNVERGRVNNIVEKYLDVWKLSEGDTLIYVCGHPGMIKDVKGRLNPEEDPKGWQVKEERYWKD